MSHALRIAGTVVAFVICLPMAQASGVGEREIALAPTVAEFEASGGGPTPLPAAWTTPAQDRGAGPSWRTWRAPDHGASRYRPYVQWHSIAEEAARKAYWRGWYDRQRSAANSVDAGHTIRPRYRDYRDGFPRYQPRRSVQTGSLSYRNW